MTQICVRHSETERAVFSHCDDVVISLLDFLLFQTGDPCDYFCFGGQEIIYLFELRQAPRTASRRRRRRTVRF